MSRYAISLLLFILKGILSSNRLNSKDHNDYSQGTIESDYFKIFDDIKRFRSKIPDNHHFSSKIVFGSKKGYTMMQNENENIRQNEHTRQQQVLPKTETDKRTAIITPGERKNTLATNMDVLDRHEDILHLSHGTGEGLAAMAHIPEHSEEAATSLVEKVKDVTSSLGKSEDITTSFIKSKDIASSFFKPKDIMSLFDKSKDVTSISEKTKDITSSFFKPKDITLSFFKPKDIASSSEKAKDITSSFINSTTPSSNNDIDEELEEIIRHSSKTIRQNTTTPSERSLGKEPIKKLHISPTMTMGNNVKDVEKGKKKHETLHITPTLLAIRKSQTEKQENEQKQHEDEKLDTRTTNNQHKDESSASKIDLRLNSMLKDVSSLIKSKSKSEPSTQKNVITDATIKGFFAKMDSFTFDDVGHEKFAPVYMNDSSSPIASLKVSSNLEGKMPSVQSNQTELRILQNQTDDELMLHNQTENIMLRDQTDNLTIHNQTADLMIHNQRDELTAHNQTDLIQLNNQTEDTQERNQIEVKTSNNETEARSLSNETKSQSEHNEVKSLSKQNEATSQNVTAVNDSMSLLHPQNETEEKLKLTQELISTIKTQNLLPELPKEILPVLNRMDKSESNNKITRELETKKSNNATNRIANESTRSINTTSHLLIKPSNETEDITRDTESPLLPKPPNKKILGTNNTNNKTTEQLTSTPSSSLSTFLSSVNQTSKTTETPGKRNKPNKDIESVLTKLDPESDPEFAISHEIIPFKHDNNIVPTTIKDGSAKTVDVGGATESDIVSSSHAKLTNQKLHLESVPNMTPLVSASAFRIAEMSKKKDVINSVFEPECTDKKKCPGNKYCRHFECYDCHLKHHECIADAQCCDGMPCIYGRCDTKPPKSPGAICKNDGDCTNGCCVLEPTINIETGICKIKLSEFHQCSPVLYRKVWIGDKKPECGPCEDGLECTNKGIIATHLVCMKKKS